VLVGVVLQFNGPLHRDVATQAALFRCVQKGRTLRVKQVQVGANAATLILGRLGVGKIRVAFAGVMSANGMAVAPQNVFV
jgi:hypothetical protein